MKIGIISDTHNYLNEDIFKYFAPCDEIWHAGDIGQLDILERLEKFKPTYAVYGNIDDHKIRGAAPENLMMERDGLKILMTHIAGSPPRYNSRVKALIEDHRPNMLVCGHSHILKVQPDKKNNLLFVNPGAAGQQGFHKVRTLLRMDIREGQFKNLEVIELGARGKI